MTTQEIVAVVMERAALADSAPLIPQLSYVGVTWHATRPLEKAGITTFGHLAARTDAELIEVPGFGERRLEIVKAALRRMTGGEA